jgi:hypothetical protein
LQALAPLIRLIVAPEAVVSAVPILKTNSAPGFPCASRTSAPVRAAEESKQ